MWQPSLCDILQSPRSFKRRQDRPGSQHAVQRRRFKCYTAEGHGGSNDQDMQLLAIKGDIPVPSGLQQHRALDELIRCRWLLFKLSTARSMNRRHIIREDIYWQLSNDDGECGKSNIKNELLQCSCQVTTPCDHKLTIRPQLVSDCGFRNKSRRSIDLNVKWCTGNG